MIRSSQQSVQFTPSLNLDFRTGVMPSGLTFTRNSIGTYFDSAGVLQTAAANVPRFDYDPVTLAIKGLLIEEARTNSLLNSDLPSGSSWSRTAVTIASVGNTGLGNASSFRCDYTSTADNPDASSMVQVISANASTTWTGSVWVKGEGSNIGKDVKLELRRNSGTYSANVVTLTLTGAWQKLTSTITLLSDNSGVRFYLYGRTATSVLMCIPQLEQGAFPTSYIPTTSAVVTRAVDMCSLPIGSWYNQSEGTWQLEALKPLPQGVPSRYLNLYGSGGSQQFYITNDPTATSMGVALIDSANSTLFSAGVSGIPTGSVVKMSVGMRSADYRTFVNGNVINTTSAGLLPAFNMIYLGNIPGGIRALNGHLRQVAYYPRRLPNSFLQSLTA